MSNTGSLPGSFKHTQLATVSLIRKSQCQVLQSIHDCSEMILNSITVKIISVFSQ